MNKNDVLKVAHECGASLLSAGGGVLSSEDLERFAAAMYAKGAEDMRERADDAWADAIQSDCEHGVKWLSENAADTLHVNYPALAKLGKTIRALPISDSSNTFTPTNEGEQ